MSKSRRLLSSVLLFGSALVACEPKDATSSDAARGEAKRADSRRIDPAQVAEDELTSAGDHPVPSGEAGARHHCAAVKTKVVEAGERWDETFTLAVPASFPKPPEGAVLCGTAFDRGVAHYFLRGRTALEVAEEYRRGLVASGFVTTDSSSGSGVVRYDNGALRGSGAYEGGVVEYDDARGALTLSHRREKRD